MKQLPLTPRQRLFVEAYLKSRNASQAAQDAGYAWPRAQQYGSDLLKRPHIRQALRERGLEPPRGVHPRTQSRKPRVNPPRAGLTLREHRFALAYLACGNAAQAARRIGIGPVIAGRTGMRLRHRPHVAAFIEKERAALAERARIDAERVMQELARIAFSDMRAIADWSQDDVTVKPAAAISEDAGAAIAELRLKPGRKGLRTKIKLHSKPQALARLARILGLDKPAGAAAAKPPDAKRESGRDILARLLHGADGTDGAGS
jgi:phage terminase small subunit